MKHIPNDQPILLRCFNMDTKEWLEGEKTKTQWSRELGLVPRNIDNILKRLATGNTKLQKQVHSDKTGGFVTFRYPRVD